MAESDYTDLAGQLSDTWANFCADNLLETMLGFEELADAVAAVLEAFPVVLQQRDRAVEEADAFLVAHAVLLRERDEARAEVERLREELAVSDRLDAEAGW